MRLPAILALIAIGASPAVAQRPARIDAATRQAVVDSLAGTLEARYVFPETGRRMAQDLRTRLARGEYDAISDGETFARALTEATRAIAHDGHLRVQWGSAGGVPLDDAPPADEQARRRTWMRQVNYGYERVQRLSGNVGYIELRGFMNADDARETALAAMRFLGNVDALIVDLRRNGGGDPKAVALLSTFLFPRGKRVHLNDLYWRDGDRTEEFWTDPDLDVPRITGPVYVLTSRVTFSAAEEFTYNLKQLRRATQVGEVTGGGANPGRGVRLHPNFAAFVPSGRAINPITRDNWEGKGCAPEIPTSAAGALRTAHLKALETLLSAASDPGYRAALQGAIDDTRRAPQEPFELPSSN